MHRSSEYTIAHLVKEIIAGVIEVQGGKGHLEETGGLGGASRK